MASSRVSDEGDTATRILDSAQLIVSALEGAMLVARPYGDVERFEAAAERLLTGFRVTP